MDTKSYLARFTKALIDSEAGSPQKIEPSPVVMAHYALSKPGAQHGEPLLPPAYLWVVRHSIGEKTATRSQIMGPVTSLIRVNGRRNAGVYRTVQLLAEAKTPRQRRALMMLAALVMIERRHFRLDQVLAPLIALYVKMAGLNAVDKGWHPRMGKLLPREPAAVAASLCEPERLAELIIKWCLDIQESLVPAIVQPSATDRGAAPRFGKYASFFARAVPNGRTGAAGTGEWDLLSRDELERLVWTSKSEDQALRFGLSRPSIRRRCNALGIRLPPRGYWILKEFGKDVVPLLLQHGIDPALSVLDEVAA